MKTLRIITLIIAASFLMSSCAISFRDDSSAVTDHVPLETETLETPTTVADTEASTEALAGSETTEIPTEETTEDVTEAVTEESIEETAAATTEQTTEEVTEADTTATVDLIDPPAGAYRPKALMYHLILEEVYGPYENLFVRPAEFELQLSILNELGYEYLFANEWRVTEKPSVIITLDDGYEDNYTEMFPLLKKYGGKATVFLVTDLIGTDGYMTREMIREMSDSGLVSFQCHTAHHSDLSYMSEASLRSDFDESCGIIEEITGKPVTALAYPAGSFNSTVLAVADEYFDFAYTTKSPYSTPEYTDLTVPRYYIARGFGRQMFLNYVGY